jgi:hypothetical protein
MNTELNMEAERAAFEAHMSQRWAPTDFDRCPDETYRGHIIQDAWTIWQAARRTVDTSVDTTAPVSAPIVEELPLPKYPQMNVLIEGMRSEQCGYTADQLRAVVAPYAERIRQLERELAERKTASTGEASPDAVREALQTMVDRFGPCENDYIFSKRQAIQKARAALIAYIDNFKNS